MSSKGRVEFTFVYKFLFNFILLIAHRIKCFFLYFSFFGVNGVRTETLQAMVGIMVHSRVKRLGK